MLTTIDIGNTHIVTAILDEKGNILSTFRVTTKEKLTEDEYFTYFKTNLDYNNIDINSITDIIISSVVPNLNCVFDYFGKKYFNKLPLKIDTNLNLPFTFAPHINSSGFGADRIINIVQSLKEYPNETLIIFDLGTATTYEVIQNNTYIGGGIFPGIEMSLNALYTNTAKLPKVSFSKPNTVLGYDVVSAIQGAIFYGYIGQLREIITAIKSELNCNAKVICTGGLGKFVASELNSIDVYDPNLGLKGLFTIYKTLS